MRPLQKPLNLTHFFLFSFPFFLVSLPMQLLMSEGLQAQVTQSRKSVTDSLSQQRTQLFQVSPYDQGTWLNNFENRFTQPQIPTNPYQQFPDIQKQINERTGQGTWFNNFENRFRQPQIPTNYQQFPDIQKQIDDRINEGISHNNFGNIYAKLGQYQNAINSYQQSLDIAKQIGSFTDEGVSHNNLGNAYIKLGQYQNAINSYEQSLDIANRIGDLKGRGVSLNNLGNVYDSLEQYPKAIDNYQQSLALAKQIGDFKGARDSLDNLGDVYDSLKQHQKAIDSYQQSLVIAKQIGDLNGERNSLDNLAKAYENRKKYQSTILYQPSLSVIDRATDSMSEKNSLNGQDNASEILFKKYKKLLASYQELLDIAKQRGDRIGEITSLNNLGDAHYSFGEYRKAISIYKQSLAVAKQIRTRTAEGYSLNNLGNVYMKIGESQKALDSYQQSLAIRQQISDRNSEGNSLNNLAMTFKNSNQFTLAIFFYKKSVNIFESIRTDISGLPIDLQDSYKETVSNSYINLTDLLLQENRVIEAQEAIEFLKAHELYRFLGDVPSLPSNQYGIEELPPEQEINTVYQKQKDQEISLGKELNELRRIKPHKRTSAQDRRIAQLDMQQTEIGEKFAKFIESPEIQRLISKIDLTIKDQDLLSRLSEFNALQDNLKNLQQNAVLLYPLILEDRLELILTTPDSPPIRRTVKVTSKEINQAIVEFRLALEDPRSDATKPAQKLYDWLIKPIEQDLNTAKAKTIIYAPDGQLRYIPLAALHDGKQWLTQRYRINHITAASLTDLNTKPQRQLSVLAGAYTSTGKQHNFAIGDESFNFTGLPFAEMEVTKLAETIPETTQLRNEDFSFRATKPKMDDYTIIHFATHAAFLKGQPEKSFILFGNGDRISLADIKAGAFGSLRKVDLFVLSACETGVGGNFGTGAEILGFGYLMQTAGARAAIASLWRVSDGGTQALMNAFYAALSNNEITKTEALRQAQMALITGDYKPLAGTRGNQVAIERRIREGLPNPVANNLSHPYYWAPFILIGNGL